MSASAVPLTPRRPLFGRLTHVLRITQVVAAAEFKLKYSGSALGYVWSVIKPLGLFGILYIVFGRFFKLNVGMPHYPLYLLIGIVLWVYFADATSLATTSLVARGSLMSKMSFPRVIIPISVAVTAGLTLVVNLGVVAVFIAVNKVIPRPAWLLVVLLLIELFVFTLGVGLILATMFVRLRDVSQVWELALQILFYASPIIYPVGFLPPWSKPIAFLSPFVQVIQDVRAIILPASNQPTAADIYGGWWGELLPISIAIAVFFLGLAYFRREAPWFAERL